MSEVRTADRVTVQWVGGISLGSVVAVQSDTGPADGADILIYVTRIEERLTRLPDAVGAAATASLSRALCIRGLVGRVEKRRLLPEGVEALDVLDDCPDMWLRVVFFDANDEKDVPLSMIRRVVHVAHRCSDPESTCRYADGVRSVIRIENEKTEVDMGLHLVCDAALHRERASHLAFDINDYSFGYYRPPSKLMTP